MKKILVCGAGGFIGGAMMKRLKAEGHWVRGVDIKEHEYFDCHEVADHFVLGDLRDPQVCEQVVTEDIDEIYQFAADMGGAGFIFTGDNDANIMYNSASINLNILKTLVNINEKQKVNKTKVFYSSSACIYPEENQLDPNNPNCEESSAYPANPDSEYGWEKLFSERIYFAFNKNFDIDIRVARYHNIFGPEGTWDGGREKAPAAICRKVAKATEENDFEIEVWGDGEQTRSFLYIDECIEATKKLMESDFKGPINIGSEEMVTINQLVETAAKVSEKDIKIKHIDGPLGVRGRNSNNDLVREKLNWDYSMSLEEGITKTYEWIHSQIYSNVNTD